MTIDRENIQGFVVRGYRLPFAAYLFLRIDDAATARSTLGEFIPQVITAKHWTDKPESGINVAFSFEGLKALGLGDRSLDAFPAEFRAGMAGRADVLGDIGDSAPEHWEDPFRDGSGHVMVMVSAKDPAALAERRSGIQGAVERRGGATVVGVQDGAALEGGREHFGYADGFAQPTIEGSGSSRCRARAPSTATAGARSSRASCCSAIPTSRASSPPRRRPTASGSTAPTSSTASSTRTSPPSGGCCATPPPTTTAARSCWRPRSSAAGATARRSPSRPSVRTPTWPRTRRATTRSTTATTPRGCAARSARTSGG
jgi:hypothetical protein